MVFFLHIPKTAGSTLNYIIKNNFHDQALEIRWHWTTWIKRPELLAKLKQVDVVHKKLIHGHFVFGTHELLGVPDAKYVTFVREPLSKAISGFHHIKRDSKAAFHLDYKDKQLDDYLIDDRIFENDNGLVRRLSGVGDEVPFGEVNATHLDKAMENINRYFLGVGLTEQFDLSIAWFKALGIFTNVYYWKQNITKNKNSGKAIKPSEDVLKKFRELNQFDLELYAYCVKYFTKGTEHLTFSQPLFNIKNKLYNVSLLPVKAIRKLSKVMDKKKKVS